MKNPARNTMPNPVPQRPFPFASVNAIKLASLLSFTFLLQGIAGCATNLVTGKSELSIISEAWELKTGAQQYLPARQSQGGDYVADPGVQAYVQEVGNKLALVSDRSLPYEFSVINDSTPNAWALPGGKIAINRGLLTELNSEAELAAVLGHEVIHAAAKHSAKSIQRGIIGQAVVVAAGVAAAGSDYSEVAVIGASGVSTLMNSKYGRDAERESDYYGMNYMSRAGYDPQGAVDLQQTFVNLKDSRQPNFLQGLFASHPPSQERLEANRIHAANLPAGGIQGRQRYRDAMQRLTQTKQGYKAYDEAKLALSDNRTKAARRLVNQAIDIEPNEGHFFALLGDIEAQEKKLGAADIAFDQAIALNPNFFYPLLRSGIVNEKRGRTSKAKRHLNRSLALLQTAQAYGALGAIAEREGNIQEAEEFYAKAAADGSATGQAAMTSLVTLRSKERPESVVGLRWGTNTDGTIVIEATNRTPRSLQGVGLQVRLVDGQGIRRSYKQRISILSPNQAKTLATGLQAGTNQVQVVVTGIQRVVGK
jgi:predicted Zn-dependent protease